MSAFLHDRPGYDAIFAQCVVIALIGVALELAALDALRALLIGNRALLALPPREGVVLGAIAAFFLTTASLGYRLVFGLCGALDPHPGARRVIALLAAPLGPTLAGVVMSAFDSPYGPGASQTFLLGLVLSYATLGLPLIAAAIWAGRKIAGQSLRAEHVFGGPT